MSRKSNCRNPRHSSSSSPALIQYIKSETSEQTPDGQVARAIRQISEKASTRIGRKAFEVALARQELRNKMGQSAATGMAKVTVCHKVSTR